MEKIKIELDEEEARLFVLFRQHQNSFQILLDGGVFDSLIGRKVIHKDGPNIRMIETTVIRKF